MTLVAVKIVPLNRPKNPMPVLEAMPGWWRGKAHARIQFAWQAAMRGDDTERDIHLRTAAEYERRAERG